jgi:hypothetical protein
MLGLLFILAIVNFEVLLHIHFVVFLWAGYFQFFGNTLRVYEWAELIRKVKNSLEVAYLTFPIS